MDVLKHEVTFSVVRLVATCIICLGFLLMLLPEEWDSLVLQFLVTIANEKSDDHEKQLTEASIHACTQANKAVSIPLG